MDSLKSYALSVLKIAGTAVGTWYGLEALGIPTDETKGGIVMALVFWGSVMVFFGKHMQGKNFWAGHRGSIRWVDTATPYPLWAFAGGLLWVGAILCLVLMG